VPFALFMHEHVMMSVFRALVFAVAMAFAGHTSAGPPYVTDDPEPTDYQHYEIYLFSSGTHARDGISGASGIDFNYGAGPDLQLTAALPFAFDGPRGAGRATGLGNIELAAKYRFAHKEGGGWDIAVFPRLFLPSSSARVGEKHFSLLLPIWLGRDWDKWSTFGGGGCQINRGGDAKDFCMAGWALTRQVTQRLQLGAEIVHQTADTKRGNSSTQIGAGWRYDLNDRCHVLGYVGPSIQNAANDDYTWYTSFLFTF
jgi:Putative MetA-pathway of phenol degradation